MCFYISKFNRFLGEIQISDDMNLPHKEHFYNFINNADDLKTLYGYFYWLKVAFSTYKKRCREESFESYLQKMELAKALEDKLKKFLDNNQGN